MGKKQEGPKDEAKKDVQKALKEKLGQSQVLGMEIENSLHKTKVQPRRGLRWLWRRDIFGGASRKELAMFSHQMSLLLSVGVAPAKALEIMAYRITNPNLQKTIADISDLVKRGTSISSAMARHHRVFDEFYVNTIKAAEAGGVLKDSFQILGDYIENDESIRGKISSAMMYPLLTLTAAIIAFFFLMIFVVPTFGQVYDTVQADLPWPTRLTLGFGDFFAGHSILMFIIIIILIFVVRWFFHARAGRSLAQRIGIHLPIIGRISRDLAIYRFAQLMQTMLTAKVPFITSLRIAKDAANNVVLQEALERGIRTLEDGRTLAEQLRNEYIFPDMVVDIISVGEETGNMLSVFRRITESYQKEIDNLVNTVATLIEPFITVAVGLIVAFIALSMFLPYFYLTRVLPF